MGQSRRRTPVNPGANLVNCEEPPGALNLVYHGHDTFVQWRTNAGVRSHPYNFPVEVINLGVLAAP